MKEYIVQAENNYDYIDLVMYQDGKELKELIRCKDCKWWNTDEDECWLSGLDTDGYEYCSWAERKEECGHQ